MEKHIFYRKYANIPLPERKRHFSPLETSSPDYLYNEIRKQEAMMDMAKRKIEKLLSIAGEYMK